VGGCLSGRSWTSFPCFLGVSLPLCFLVSCVERNLLIFFLSSRFLKKGALTNAFCPFSQTFIKKRFVQYKPHLLLEKWSIFHSPFHQSPFGPRRCCSNFSTIFPALHPYLSRQRCSPSFCSPVSFLLLSSSVFCAYACGIPPFLFFVSPSNPNDLEFCFASQLS